MNINTRVGATFAIPLADGQFGAIRIVGIDSKKDGGGAWFVATQYVGPKPPKLSESALSKIQILDTSGYSSAPRSCVWWQRAAEPMPDDYPFIGLVKSSNTENKSAIAQSLECRYTWEKWAAIILHQWRWDHDRDGLIRGKYNNSPKPTAKSKQSSKRTLADLRNGPFFEGWQESGTAKVTRAARKIAREAVNELILLGEKPTKRKAAPILRKFIESFNNMASDIDTIAREEILEFFDEMVDALGLKNCDKLAEEWREF